MFILNLNTLATLAQIKADLGVTALNFSRCKNQDGTPSEFLRHWDAKRRFSFVAHQDVIAKIKANPDTNKLATKWEPRETQEHKDDKGNVTNADTAGLTYDSYILIFSENIEESL